MWVYLCRHDLRGTMQGRAPTNCILCLTLYVVLFFCVVSHSPLSINISLVPRSSSLSDHTGRENKYTRFMHRQKKLRWGHGGTVSSTSFTDVAQRNKGKGRTEVRTRRSVKWNDIRKRMTRFALTRGRTRGSKCVVCIFFSFSWFYFPLQNLPTLGSS